ncbi:MAG: SDR family oxidoreductase [Bacteroidales bacterium]|nr:SDR family oxidoreductase [Bacteroidales bacterium]
MKDKVVIVTGASSGIGLACAKAFFALNAKVVIASRSEDKLKQIAEELDSTGENCLVVKTDVVVEEDCKNLIENTVRKFGKIDILINNAGISMRALLDEVEICVLKKVMDVNFWGTVYCTKYALPYIQKTKGIIVGISSIAGFHGLPGRTAYSASKFAMHGFMESIRIENFKKGVHVLILAAGFTATNIRKRALDAHGNEQGETPRNEEKLTSPEIVAKNLIRSIKKRKRTRIMTIEGQLMVLFQRIVPLLTDLVIFNKFKKEPNSPIR